MSKTQPPPTFVSGTGYATTGSTSYWNSISAQQYGFSAIPSISYRTIGKSISFTLDESDWPSLSPELLALRELAEFLRQLYREGRLDDRPEIMDAVGAHDAVIGGELKHERVTIAQLRVLLAKLEERGAEEADEVLSAHG